MTHIGETITAAAFVFLTAVIVLPRFKPAEIVTQKEKADARQTEQATLPKPVPEIQPLDENSIATQLELTVDPKLIELRRLMVKQQVRVDGIEKRVDQLERKRGYGNGQ